MIALRGVVIHDIEDDLDPGAVQGLHHRFEFPDRLAGNRRGGVRTLWREESDGVVSPIVGQAAVLELSITHKMVDWQEFNRRDAERIEMLNGRWGSQPSVRASECLGHIRMSGGKAFDVHFIDDGSFPGGSEQLVTTPGKGRCNHDRLGHIASVVPVVPGKIGRRVADTIPEHGIGPFDRPGDGLGVRIDEELGWSKSVSRLRFVRPVYAVAVVRSGPRFWQVHMPNVFCPLLDPNSMEFLV